MPARLGASPQYQSSEVGNEGGCGGDNKMVKVEYQGLSWASLSRSRTWQTVHSLMLANHDFLLLTPPTSTFHKTLKDCLS